MKMDTTIFESRKFNRDSDTKLICPDCNSGHLIAKTENINQVDYVRNNKEAAAHPEFDLDWLKFAFNGFLECNNPNCQEKIVVAGKIELNYGTYIDESNDDECYNIEEYICFPEYFERAPRIIEIIDTYPDNIQEILKSSFSLFWTDKASCANRLRLCIEKSLDSLKIARYPRNGKRIPLSLNKRIDKFCKNNPRYKSILTATKWIGNIGSHSNEIKLESLLNAYRLIEYMLKELFCNEEKEVLKLSKKINKTKGR
jgi:hypothetical protein